MRRWLFGFALAVAGLGGAVWWALLDGAAPARAEGVFDLAAYRALVSDDAPEALPTDVSMVIVGQSEAPSFATEAGAFDGTRAMVFPAFHIASPGGAIVIDAAVDQDTLAEMSDGAGRFDAGAYAALLDAISNAAHVLITHEHLDHVIAITRHPAPDAIAPRLRLSQAQLNALPEHAPGGVLAPAIASLAPLDLGTPRRIAPGVVAHSAPGHTPGTIVIYVRTAAREYFFIGDIVWQMSNIERARGRPRAIGWIVPGVDPDRPAVLRQIRALHDLAAAEPELVLVPAHDSEHLRALVAAGALREGFPAPPAAAAPLPAP